MTDSLRDPARNGAPPGASGLAREAKIYVAGHTGLAGSAILRRLRAEGLANPVTRTHDELELRDASAVRRFFEAERPDAVVLCAAKVGGILANDTYPADFVHDNLLIQTNVIGEAWRAGVKRLLFLGSSCIYPRDCPQPIREAYLLTGPLEPTNRPYAVAKIAGIELCWGLNRQYGTEYLAVMPTNLYGPNDSYDLETSHVLPAIIRKMHEAKSHGRAEVTLWGTGRPRRELLHSDDMAAACVFLMRLDGAERATLFSPGRLPLVNIGCGEDLTIRELASLVAEVVGFKGRIAWDSSKPDGTPRKLLDVSVLRGLGWAPRLSLREGVAAVYRDYLASL
jgi:GDP-L-fucose synthase